MSFWINRFPENSKVVQGLTSSLYHHHILRGPKSLMVSLVCFRYTLQAQQKLNPKTQAARIGGSVGTKKRIEIEKKADDLDLRVLNL